MKSVEVAVGRLLFFLGKGIQSAQLSPTRFALLEKKRNTNRKDCNKVEFGEGNKSRNIKHSAFLNLEGMKRI